MGTGIGRMVVAWRRRRSRFIRVRRIFRGAAKKAGRVISGDIVTVNVTIIIISCIISLMRQTLGYTSASRRHCQAYINMKSGIG